MFKVKRASLPNQYSRNRIAAIVTVITVIIINALRMTLSQAGSGCNNWSIFSFNRFSNPFILSNEIYPYVKCNMGSQVSSYYSQITVCNNSTRTVLLGGGYYNDVMKVNPGSIGTEYSINAFFLTNVDITKGRCVSIGNLDTITILDRLYLVCIKRGKDYMITVTDSDMIEL